MGGGGNFLTGSWKKAKGQFYYTANVRERAAGAGKVWVAGEEVRSLSRGGCERGLGEVLFMEEKTEGPYHQ